jgi:predicted RNase H-like nuclease (RuvC/YqgF family)
MIPDIKNRKPLNILSIDPGETSGLALFLRGELHSSFHLKINDLEEIKQLLTGGSGFDYIIIESFRIYAHKAKSLTNDPMITPKIIGKLEEWFKGYKIVYQSASQAKGFFTNDRLKEMGLYVSNRHERDAIRHALYGLYFNKEVI